MAKNVMAVILGLFTAFLLNTVVLMINYHLFPLPQNLDQSDFEAMSEYMLSLPSIAHLIILLAHIISATGAGFVVSRIASSYQLVLAGLLGGFLTIMGVINLLQVPHPTWFNAIDPFVHLSFAYMGYRVGRKY